MNKIHRVAAPVRGQVENLLRTAIETGELRPGARLIEREICESFGVSRPLVREALRRLESDGLARVLPAGGMAVAVIEEGEAREIYAVRRELEGLAAALCAERGDPELRQALRQAKEALEAARDAGNSNRLIEAKNEFYAVLARGSGNRLLQDLLANLHGRIRLLRGTSLSNPGRPDQMVQELGDIAAAILDGDPARARTTTEIHIDNAVAATRAALAEARSATVPTSVGAAATTK